MAPKVGEEVVTSSPTLGAMAFGIGFSLAALLYFTKLMNWLAKGECRAETPTGPDRRWRRLNGKAGAPSSTLAEGGAPD